MTTKNLSSAEMEERSKSRKTTEENGNGSLNSPDKEKEFFG